MGKEFKICRRYYDERIMYKKSKVTIEPGVTVLIGCNGAGKSTLQQIMKDQLKSEQIEYLSFDNLKQGGDRAMSGAAFYNNFDLMASMVCSSEGENIRINLLNVAKNIGGYLKDGEDNSSFSKRLIKIFKEDEEEKVQSDERWLFFDAVDSGYSIDNVIEFKELLEIIMEDFKDSGLDLYIVVTANEYEMCINEPCLSVIDLKYVNINSYDEYKKFILESRKYKDKQIDKYYGEE